MESDSGVLDRLIYGNKDNNCCPQDWFSDCGYILKGEKKSHFVLYMCRRAERHEKSTFLLYLMVFSVVVLYGSIKSAPEDSSH